MKKSKRNEPKCTRREALYAHIIGCMTFNNLWPEHGHEAEYQKKQGNFYLSREFAKGDLIMTEGSMRCNPNPWNVGRCLQKMSDNEVVILDIFTGWDCHYENESYLSIHNIPFDLTLSDKEHALYRRFVNAIRAVDYWQFEFRVAHGEPIDKGVRFFTREKWEGDRIPHEIPFKMKSSEIRDKLTAIMDERKQAKEVSA